MQDVGSLTSGLQALAQPFKLRLCRGAHESQLRDYSSNVVLIEPLATISAVEDFLWLRVYRSPSSAGAAGGAEAERGRSPGTAAAEAGAGAASRSAAAARGSQVCCLSYPTAASLPLKEKTICSSVMRNLEGHCVHQSILLPMFNGFQFIYTCVCNPGSSSSCNRG